MMICAGCNQERQHLRGAIIDGIYNQYCLDCTNHMKRQPSAQSASYHRDREREAHAKDLLQPWNPDHTPNRDFIRAYPAQAKDNFNQSELETYG